MTSTSSRYDRSRFDSLEDWWEWLKRQAPDQAREIDYRARRLDVAADLGESKPPVAITSGTRIA